MAAKCKSRVKYVDDATAMEIIPRCSPSYLPFTVSDIYTYASLRGMKLNLKKCNEMIINFMQYSRFPPVPPTVGGSVIERVLAYKLFGVYISEDLSWNVHIEHTVKKANKRLYALRTLKEARNSFSFFQTNKHILFLDTVRVIISRQNLARVLSTHYRFLTLHFPPKYRYHGNDLRHFLEP